MRIFRLVATPVLLLGLLAFLVWGAFWGWRNLTAPLPSPEPTPCVTQTVEIVTIRDVSVRIYNGGFTSGLARRQSARLEEAGFRIVRVDNSDERITGTVIRANERDVSAIRLVTSYFKDAVFEGDDRTDGTVDVFLGSDFPGEGETPLGQVVPADGTVCLPPSPEPSESPTAPVTPEPTATQS